MKNTIEVLINYGWAIIIVIIVGVAIYKMGAFTPQLQSFEPEWQEHCVEWNYERTYSLGEIKEICDFDNGGWKDMDKCRPKLYCTNWANMTKADYYLWQRLDMVEEEIYDTIHVAELCPNDLTGESVCIRRRDMK